MGFVTFVTFIVLVGFCCGFGVGGGEWIFCFCNFWRVFGFGVDLVVFIGWGNVDSGGEIVWF